MAEEKVEVKNSKEGENDHANNRIDHHCGGDGLFGTEFNTCCNLISLLEIRGDRLVQPK